MEENARLEWNRRYAERSHLSVTPDPFWPALTMSSIAPSFPQGGRALDLAGGVGRHAVYLAKRGWDVTLVDVSEVGLTEASRHAERSGAHVLGNILMERRDLTDSELPAAHYDLVLVFFYLERSLFAQIIRALKPGGMVVYKTYTSEQKKMGGGPTHPMHLLERNELLHAFGALHILHYHETIRDKAVAELVGQTQEP